MVAFVQFVLDSSFVAGHTSARHNTPDTSKPLSSTTTIVIAKYTLGRSIDGQEPTDRDIHRHQEEVAGPRNDQ